MNLKSYNIYSAIAENKITITILILIGVLIGIYSQNKNLIQIYGVVVTISLVIYFTQKDLKSFNVTRDYIVLNEPEINTKYEIKRGLGYINFYRNFSDNEIDKMLKTPIKEDFIKCYKYPIKLGMSFLFLLLTFVVVSLI